MVPGLVPGWVHVETNVTILPISITQCSSYVLWCCLIFKSENLRGRSQGSNSRPSTWKAFCQTTSYHSFYRLILNTHWSLKTQNFLPFKFTNKNDLVIALDCNNVGFQIPVTYPTTAPELALPGLDGKTAKMYRGGKICLTDHFKPLWARNVPRFGIAHAMALGVRIYDQANDRVFVENAS